MAKAKNVVEATITQLHKEKDGIVAIVGEEKYSELLNFFIEKNKQKHPDYIPNFRDVGRPSSDVTMDDLIKDDPLDWLEDVFPRICDDLSIKTKTDKFKLAIVLTDLGLIQWGNNKKVLVKIMELLLKEDISDSYYYQCFAKIGMSADPDSYIPDFFPNKERTEIIKKVESWLRYACYDECENDLYAEYMAYLRDSI